MAMAEEQKRGAGCGSIIFVIVLAVLGINQLVQSEGNVGVAVSEQLGLSTGDCIQNISGYPEVACDSPNADFIVTGQSDENGATCSASSVGIIEQYRTRGAERTTYWCIANN